MTGPRSRGCMTCVKRRVKCDESRPSCRRCIRAKVPCQGYSKPLIIVQEQPRNVGLVKRATFGAAQAHPSRLQHQVGTEVALFWPARHGVRGLRGHRLEILTAPTNLTEDLYLGYFVDRMQEATTRNSRYLDAATFVMKASYAAKLSMEALSSMFFGMTHALPQITYKATTIYGKALRILAYDLQKHSLSIDTLSAMTALTMYGLLAFTTTDAWCNHINGVGRYTQMLGPEVFQVPSARALLSQNRTILIGQAVMSRKATFHAEERWKTIPWQNDPASKEQLDYLFDIVADIAAISADIDALHTFQRNATHLQMKLSEIAGRLAASSRMMLVWWKLWIASNSHRCWKVPIDQATTLCIDEAGPWFTERLEFDSFITCYALMVHDAARILLLGLEKELSRRFAIDVRHEVAQKEQESSLAGSTNNSQRLISQVMSCIDYCDRQTKDYVSTFCVMFPLWIAANYVRDDSRESEWMCQACKIENDSLFGFVAGAGRVSIKRVSGGVGNRNGSTALSQ